MGPAGGAGHGSLAGVCSPIRGLRGMSEHSFDVDAAELEHDLSVVSDALVHSFEIDMAPADDPFLSDLVHHGVERMVEEGRIEVADRVEAVSSLTQLMSSTATEYGSIRIATENAIRLWPFK